MVTLKLMVTLFYAFGAWASTCFLLTVKGMTILDCFATFTTMKLL